MNVVREISKINERELDLGLSGASWHDEYKDSAYIFAGGLNFELTEGDVITIFSQYGEIMDINMPRDKETGKSKGFAFLMYEDQRSTVLAVDNLNGAKVLERTLRVDHVKNYKQKRTKGEGGEWQEPEEQSLNARPEVVIDGGVSDSSAESAPDIDPDDPMRDYLLQKWREERQAKKAKKGKSKGKHKDETPEERRARKERKRAKKARKAAGKSEGLKGVEALLQSLDERPRRPPTRSPSPSPRRAGRRAYSRSLSPEERERPRRHDGHPRPKRRSISRSLSPRRNQPRRDRSRSRDRWGDRSMKRDAY